MATANGDADEALLNMLNRYGVLMLEDLITGRPDFNLAQLFFAIERLSQTNVIALRRIGLRYEIRLTHPAWPLELVPRIKSRLRRNDDTPDVCDREFGIERTWSTNPSGPGQKGKEPQ